METVEDLTFPCSKSTTKFTTDCLKVFMLNAVKNLISATIVPVGV